MAYKLNENEVARIKDAVRGCKDALNSIEREAENDLTWSPYILEKADKLVFNASLIQRIANEAIQEERTK